MSEDSHVGVGCTEEYCATYLAGDETPYTVLFVALTLAVGALVRRTFYHSPIPYTLLMFVFGILWGFLSFWWPSFCCRYAYIAFLNPEIIFYLFIPILVMDSTLNISPFIWRSVFWQSVILAFPGVVFATFLTAVLSRYANASFDWCWELWLLFGSVISATDPVAVVALLNDLGADHSVSTMIEGESLLNDGVAIAFFAILEGTITSCHVPENFWEVSGWVFQIIFGAVGTGIVAAIILLLVLVLIFDDYLAETCLILVFSLITFFAAEVAFGASGVIAVVTLGIIVSKSRGVISPEVEEPMKHTLELVVWGLNTVLFTLSGVIVVIRAGGAADELLNWIGVLSVYGIIHVVRAAVIFISFPLLNAPIGSFQLSPASAVLAWWGGLRGAVSLMLGLLVLNRGLEVGTHGILGDVKQFFFLIAGVVFLTLTINAPLSQLVVKTLKLAEVTATRKKDVYIAIRRLRASMRRTLLALRTDTLYADSHYGTVARIAIDGTLTDYLNGDQEPPELTTAQSYEYVRNLYIHSLRASMRKQHRAGLLSTAVFETLDEWLNRILDKRYHWTPGTTPILLSSRHFEEFLSPHIVSSPLFVFTSRIPIVRRLTQWYLQYRVFMGYSIAVGYIQAVADASRLLDEHLPIALYESLGQVVVRTAAQCSASVQVELHSLSMMLDHFAIDDSGQSRSMAMTCALKSTPLKPKQTNREHPQTHAVPSDKAVKYATRRSDQHFSGAPLFDRELRSVLSARIVLNAAKRHLVDYHKEGMLKHHDYYLLMDQLERRMQSVKLGSFFAIFRSHHSEYHPLDRLRHMPWFAIASADMRARLEESARILHFVDLEEISREGTHADHLFLVDEGVVLIQSGQMGATWSTMKVDVGRFGQKEYHATGGFVAGLYSILSDTQRPYTMRATGPVTVIAVPSEQILEAAREVLVGEEMWWESAVRTVAHFMSTLSSFSHWSAPHIKRFIQENGYWISFSPLADFSEEYLETVGLGKAAVKDLPRRGPVLSCNYSPRTERSFTTGALLKPLHLAFVLRGKVRRQGDTVITAPGMFPHTYVGAGSVDTAAIRVGSSQPEHLKASIKSHLPQYLLVGTHDVKVFCLPIVRHDSMFVASASVLQRSREDLQRRVQTVRNQPKCDPHWYNKIPRSLSVLLPERFQRHLTECLEIQQLSSLPDGICTDEAEAHLIISKSSNNKELCFSPEPLFVPNADMNQEDLPSAYEPGPSQTGFFPVDTLAFLRKYGLGVETKSVPPVDLSRVTVPMQHFDPESANVRTPRNKPVVP